MGLERLRVNALPVLLTGPFLKPVRWKVLLSAPCPWKTVRKGKKRGMKLVVSPRGVSLAILIGLRLNLRPCLLRLVPNMLSKGLSSCIIP